MSDVLSSCRLCPRECGADRRAGERGYCHAGPVAEVYRYGIHEGEEPPISGRRGSGTVFFSRCTMRCVYCQNYPWSQGLAGREYTVGELAAALSELADRGCHNWNLVSPTPWLPQIREAVDAARAGGASLPIVYNTSGFERAETLRGLAGWVSVYLSNLRYARPETAAAGSGTPGYVEAARAALREMWGQVGPLRTDASGVAEAGVICRLLILPGLAEEAVESLAWVARVLGTDVPVSIMAQYTPVHKAATMEPWNRPIRRGEYERVCAAAEELGFGSGWTQEFGEPAPPGLLGCEMPPEALAAPAAAR